jgi:hypothetical protein
MFSGRAAWSIASIFLGLASASAQVQGTVAPGQVQGTTTVTPPLFQGILLDAKGKTVGRLVLGPTSAPNVVRQISGVWVMLQFDLETGFAAIDFSLQYLYQSADCTGQAYLPLSGVGQGVMAPEIGQISMVPPVTVPTIYFAGQPASVLNIKSGQFPFSPGSCRTYGTNANGFLTAVGFPQSVPVSDLGLTPPFKIK